MSAIGKLASWMMQHGYATGHGESMDDLLAELTWQIEEKIEMEREACAVIAFNAKTYLEAAEAIRARGQS